MRTILACIALGAALGWPFEAEAADAAPFLVTVSNPLGWARSNTTVEISRDLLPAARRTLDFQRMLVVNAASGEEVVSQAIRWRGERPLDELLFQTDLGPHEKKTFLLKARATGVPSPAAVARVHARRFLLPSRDDFGWENDRIAFRSYGPGTRHETISSGVDVWFKKGGRLVLERWFAPNFNYHVDAGEGADFYKVGPARGCGGTALWRNGAAWASDNFADARVLADGPIRAIFELDYAAWKAAEIEATERKRISIDAGQDFCRHEITLRASPPRATLDYVVGLGKSPGHAPHALAESGKRCWWATWGFGERPEYGAFGTAAIGERQAFQNLVARVFQWNVG